MAGDNGEGEPGVGDWGEHNHDTEQRLPVHFKVCAESLAAWRKFSLAHGMSLTALFDACGHVVAEEAAALDEATLAEKYPALAHALRIARRIDAEHRARRR